MLLSIIFLSLGAVYGQLPGGDDGWVLQPDGSYIKTTSEGGGGDGGLEGGGSGGFYDGGSGGSWGSGNGGWFGGGNGGSWGEGSGGAFGGGNGGSSGGDGGPPGNGWILQPDGSYMKYDNGGSESSQGGGNLPPGFVPPPGFTGSEGGWVLQPDGSYLKTIIETEAPSETLEIVNPDYQPDETYSFGKKGSPGYYNIVGFGKPGEMDYFKITPDDQDNSYDYSVEPVVSKDNPAKVTDKNHGRVILRGTKGEPNYEPILETGKMNKHRYYKIIPDSRKASNYRFMPQRVSGWHTRQGHGEDSGEVLEPEEPETSEEEPEPVPDEPEVEEKNKSIFISLGKPKRYLKLTRYSNNPQDFSLEPVESPDKPNSKPNPNDEEALEVIPQGEKGHPNYKLIVGLGPSYNKRYIQVQPDPIDPNKYNFIPLKAEEQPGEVQTEPNEDDVDFDDLPENPQYKVVKTPGKNKEHEVFSFGPKERRISYRILRRNPNNPNDVEVFPIQDTEHPESPPCSDDPNAPEVVQQGDPNNPDDGPVIKYGPKGKKLLYRLLIKKIGVPNFIPVRQLKKLPGQHRLVFQKKTRIWHFKPQKVKPSIKKPVAPQSFETAAPVEETSEYDPEEVDVVTENPETKNPHMILSFGSPKYKVYIKKTPRSPTNPYDYKLEPIGNPQDPNSKPDPKDTDAPEVIETGEIGKPNYAPVVAHGPKTNRRYVIIRPNPKNPNDPNQVELSPAELAPDSDPKKPKFRVVKAGIPIEPKDPYSESLPKNPKIKIVQKPGDPKKYEVFSFTLRKRRIYIKKVPGATNNPNDFTLETLGNPDDLNSKPDPNDPEAPEIIKGQPIVSFGPKGFKKYIIFKPNPKNPKEIQLNPAQIQPGSDPMKPKFTDLVRQVLPKSKPVSSAPPVKSELPEVKNVPGPQPYKIFSINVKKRRIHLKKTQGPSNNPDDYTLSPLDNPYDPDSKPDPKDPEAPEVIETGTRGTPSFLPILASGPKNKRDYMSVKPSGSGLELRPAEVVPGSDPNHPQFRIPVPGVPKPIIPIPNILPFIFPGIFPGILPVNVGQAQPVIKTFEKPNKKPYTVISFDKKTHIKKTSGPSNNPNDYKLEPIGNPEDPDSKPDPKDPEAPEIIENGKPGTPDYQPVVNFGPIKQRRLITFKVNPSNPKQIQLLPTEIEPGSDPKQHKFRIISQQPLISPTKPSLPDSSELPEVKDVETPDKKHINIIILKTKLKNIYIKRTPGPSGNPNEYKLEPIGNPDDPNSKPDPKDPDAPEIIESGKPGTPEYQTYVAYGPKPTRKYVSIQKHPSDPNKVDVNPAELEPGSDPKKPKFRILSLVRHQLPINPLEQLLGPFINPYQPLPDISAPEVKTVTHPDTKKPVHVISIKPKDAKPVFVLKTPGPSGNPNDFTLCPLDNPNDVKSRSDPKDPNSPQVIENGKPGTPDYAPVVEYGPKDGKKYVKITPDPLQPNDSTKLKLTRVKLLPAKPGEPKKFSELPNIGPKFNPVCYKQYQECNERS